MEELTFKMTRKNEYVYLVKQGRKITCKIDIGKDMFYCLSTQFYTLEEAIRYIKTYLDNLYNGFEDKYKINLIQNF